MFICTPWAGKDAEERFFDIVDSNPEVPLHTNCQRLVRLMERDLARIAHEANGNEARRVELIGAWKP